MAAIPSGAGAASVCAGACGSGAGGRCSVPPSLPAPSKGTRLWHGRCSAEVEKSQQHAAHRLATPHTTACAFHGSLGVCSVERNDSSSARLPWSPGRAEVRGRGSAHALPAAGGSVQQTCLGGHASAGAARRLPQGSSRSTTSHCHSNTSSFSSSSWPGMGNHRTAARCVWGGGEAAQGRAPSLQVGVGTGVLCMAKAGDGLGKAGTVVGHSQLAALATACLQALCPCNRSLSLVTCCVGSGLQLPPSF